MSVDQTLWWVLSVATPGSGAQVLDLGGGTGRSAVVFAQAGAHVTVLDRSADALATLARRADESGLPERIEGVQGDVEALTAVLGPSRAFDVVLVHDVLDGVADPLDTLGATAAAVAPGGWISVVVPNPIASVVARALAGQPGFARERAEDLAAATRLDVAAVSQVLAAAGLVVEHRLGHSVFAGALVRGVKPGPETTPDAARLYDELDAFVAPDPAYWSFATRLQVLARRPTAVASVSRPAADDAAGPDVDPDGTG